MIPKTDIPRIDFQLDFFETGESAFAGSYTEGSSLTELISLLDMQPIVNGKHIEKIKWLTFVSRLDLDPVKNLVFICNSSALNLSCGAPI